MLYETLYRERPSDRRVRNNLGLVYALNGRTSDSLQLLDLNRKQLTQSAVAHQNYAVAALFCGKTTDSLSAFRQAVALSPDTVPIRRNVAIAHMAAGHWEESTRQYAEVLRLSPDDPNDQIVYACLLLKTKQFFHASQLAGEVLKKSPSHAVALRIRDLARHRRPYVRAELTGEPFKLPCPRQEDVLIALIQ